MLVEDVKNVFGLPAVTHWRPVHNLYFLIVGNLFGKNYLGYHIFNFAIHIAVAFMIFKIFILNDLSAKAAFVGATLYSVHSAHFITLNWISGAATSIGFLFLLVAFYCFLTDRYKLSIFLYLVALLASEAMITGLVIFVTWSIFKAKIKPKSFLVVLGAVSVIFLIIKLFVFTPRATFEVYKIGVSTKTFPVIKYYLSRIFGFTEVSGDLISTSILMAWLLVLFFFLFKVFRKKIIQLHLILSIILTVSGLFPFILIPNTLSPHYMNLSIFGLCFAIASLLKFNKPAVSFLILLIFAIISVVNVHLVGQNHWVIERSKLAKFYLQKIEKDRLPPGSTVTFANTHNSTSQETYFALGSGEALRFWFPEEEYEPCFTWFEKCPTLP